MLKGIHHIAIIASNYERSKAFYTQVLGLKVLAEHYREARHSWKLDLAIDDHYCIELFSFPDPPARLSRPEATGLRHLAFAVERLDEVVARLKAHGVVCEPIRTDEWTGRRFTFFTDPDGLPLEVMEY